MKTCFALKGNVVWSEAKEKLAFSPDSYLVCEGGACAGVFPQLPEKYTGVPVEDFGDRLILPGFSDLHLHAAQYADLALGYDMQLLDWLENLTFAEEARYGDAAYADAAYRKFTDHLLRTPTTRACMFASAHTKGTLILMEQLEKAGFHAFVGRVNMDENASDIIREKDAAWALSETERWIEGALSRFENVRPILTPRFAPSCSAQLLGGLGALRRRYRLPVQSHLSEMFAEIEWVKQLFPDCPDYASVYEKFGLLSGDTPCVMAHCIHLTASEQRRVREGGVFVAHCPTSNTNVRSGVAPVREYLDAGMRVGLGCDISGGQHMSPMREAANAVMISKARSMLVPDTGYVSVDEALYMATRGGGAFFGRVGAFEPGYAFDAVVFDDARLCPVHGHPLRQRLEKLVYLSDERDVHAKYIAGRRVL